MSKLMDGLRALLETEDEPEVDEAVGDVADDEANTDAVEGDETEGDDIEVNGDEAEVEGTAGDAEETPEVADLRQQIVDQAALIETLRNQVASLGGDPVEDGVEIDGALTESDEDAVAAFDNDYAEREARLADMKG